VAVSVVLIVDVSVGVANGLVLIHVPVGGIESGIVAMLMVPAERDGPYTAARTDVPIAILRPSEIGVPRFVSVL
jgi:hypothetical protein